MKKEHEKRVCHAALDFIVKRKKIVVEKVEYPDEKERRKQAVDVLVKSSSGEIVLEHTRIESYTKQIEDWSQIWKLLKPFEAKLEGKLPTPGYYNLSVDVKATKGAKSTKRIQKALIKWIREKAPLLQLGCPEVAPAHCIIETPDGVPFQVTLCRWPGNNGKFSISEHTPDNLEEMRKERIKEALNEKCPKLLKAKEGYRNSLLLLELNDISLGNYKDVGKTVKEELRFRNDSPDDIYLVRTELRQWRLWILKEGSLIFRDVNEAGPYYLDSVCYESCFGNGGITAG